MTNEKEILIEKYFENQFSASEKEQFSELLKTDLAFKERLEFEQSVKKALHLKERKTLKNTLQGFENKKETKMISLKSWYWAGAASVAILFAFTWFLTSKKPSDADLYASYYQAYPNVVAPLVRGENEVSGEKKKAFELYEAEKFEEAAQLFKNLGKSETNEFAAFYEGQCYMALGKNEKAIEVFSNAILTDDVYPFDTQRKWYLALIYLKVGKKEDARMMLEILTNYENVQSVKANELLKKLEETE